MSLRWRLAVISSLVTLAALAVLVLGSGWALEAARLRDLDDELTVQARLVLDEVRDAPTPSFGAALTDALQGASGSSAAWVYRDGRLEAGLGVDAPEPLDAGFLRGDSPEARCSCDGWRVVSLRSGAVVAQVARSLEGLQRENNNYWRTAWLWALLSALAAGVVITVAVNRITGPLEALAKRVARLEDSAPIPALNRGDEVGALARALETSLRDLRDTRAREARFLADAAHELRTPVTALLTDLEHHAARERSIADTEAALSRARRTARHLRELTANLLTLSQVAQRPEPRAVDLLEVASRVVDRLAPLAASRGLEIGVDGTSVTVQGDAVALERAVENLVGNAIKFTDAGEVHVRVSSHGGRARLEVTDTGVGVAAGAPERLFEPFERAGETRREGSGLGLAVVTAVADAHGGAIRLEPREGGGTRAVLELPSS